MNVNIYAFELKFGKGADAKSFFNYLAPIGKTKAQKAANTLEHSTDPEASQVLVVGYPKKSPDYIAGLLLTIQDAKAFCRLSAHGGKLELSAQKLQKGNAMTHFNFFILNSNTGRGLYQHYHHSKAPTVNAG